MKVLTCVKLEGHVHIVLQKANTHCSIVKYKSQLQYGLLDGQTKQYKQRTRINGSAQMQLNPSLWDYKKTINQHSA
ncbi:hypothetical protein XELAEV_18039600mg [Xenopus laevis]|uniref:Uncharacterized protein n=1 Tax=Xenopus laevis TaxID=8355 RepID=A0A974C901_XENLA|nr:hypothetical protein XELAEV_18039600mg [Xenopus laevis]